MRTHGTLFKQQANPPTNKGPTNDSVQSEQKQITWRQAYPAETRPYHTYQELMRAKKPKPQTQSTTKTTEEKKINSLIKQSDRVLYRTRSVFPFDFFPDEVVVDETKVTIFRSNFFWTKHAQSILLENIAYVIINMTPFFAALTFEDVSFDRKERITIRYLTKNEAVLTRQIIQGLIIGKKEGVDFSKFSKEEVLKQVEQLGNVRGEDDL